MILTLLFLGTEQRLLHKLQDMDAQGSVWTDSTDF